MPDHASPKCVLASISALENLVESEIIVIDDRFRIIEEYRRHLSHSGQPGVGDAFFKWLWENQANESRCERATITQKGHDSTAFEEFPDDESLTGFDREDRKFVAVALAS